MYDIRHHFKTKFEKECAKRKFPGQSNTRTLLLFDSQSDNIQSFSYSYMYQPPCNALQILYYTGREKNLNINVYFLLNAMMDKAIN